METRFERVVNVRVFSPMIEPVVIEVSSDPIKLVRTTGRGQQQAAAQRAVDLNEGAQPNVGALFRAADQRSRDAGLRGQLFAIEMEAEP